MEERTSVQRTNSQTGYADYVGRDGDDESKGQHNRKIAKIGEQAAVNYLRWCGYDIIERNWTCEAGEADIIAWDDDELVFVEVKCRTSLKKGFPEEAVTQEKRNRYEKIAGYFLRGFDACNMSLRFDVIGILVIGSDECLVRHHINAFGVA